MTGVLPEKDTLPEPKHEDDVSRYLSEIRHYPLLTPEQELTLAKGCAEADQDAIRLMVNSNLRLVVAIAREYTGRGVPLLDLIQEGSIGLLTAARKFDYTHQCRFSTYATKWIRQGISRCVLNHAGLIRVPQHTMERIRKVLFAKSTLEQEAGTEPELQQIAAECGVAQETVRKLMDLLPEVCSLDAPAGEDGESTLQMLIEDVQTPQPYEEMVRRELRDTMEQLLNKLTPRQQKILRMRNGMYDGTCYSLEAVGKEMGISKERARQVERQAMEKLQKLGAGLGLEEYL